MTKRFTSDDLTLLRGLVRTAHDDVATKFGRAKTDDERAFYRGMMKKIGDLTTALQARNAGKVLERAIAEDEARIEADEEDDQLSSP